MTLSALEKAEGYLTSAAATAKRVEEVCAALSGSELAGTDRGWILTQGVAAAIERVYSTCEQAMLCATLGVRPEPMRRDGNWHRALLDRMVAPFASDKPPLLSREVAFILNELRAFRHRVRSSINGDLDPELVLARVPDATRAVALLRSDLRASLGPP